MKGKLWATSFPSFSYPGIGNKNVHNCGSRNKDSYVCANAYIIVVNFSILVQIRISSFLRVQTHFKSDTMQQMFGYKHTTLDSTRHMLHLGTNTKIRQTFRYKHTTCDKIRSDKYDKLKQLILHWKTTLLKATRF